MKKIVSKIFKVGSIFPLFLFLSVKAQENKIGFNFSPRAGVCFSYAGLDAQELKSFKISPDAGIEVKMDITKHFGITSGLFYTQKAKYYSHDTTQSFLTDVSNTLFGGSGTSDLILSALGATAGAINDTVYSHYSAKVNIHYLQIPIMATLDINNFSISGGFYFAFKLGAKSTETLTQTLPLLTAFEPLLSDSAIAPIIGFFTAAYPGLNQPSFNTLTPGFVKSKDYGLMGEISGRFNEHFKISSTVTYGLTNYSTNAIKYPGKHFTISFNMGVTFGNLKGTKVSTKFF